MSLWSSVRAALPTQMELSYCYECGFTSFVPSRRPAEAQQQVAAGTTPLFQAAAAPTCPRCGSAFVQVTANPSEYSDLYSQSLQRQRTSPTAVSSAASTAPMDVGSVGSSLWHVMRSVFETVEQSAPLIQREIQQSFSSVWHTVNGTESAVNEGDDALPPECRHFTAEDVLSTFEQYPHGLPTPSEPAAPSMCAICLEDCHATTTPPTEASTTPYVVQVHCGHSFHRACLVQWITVPHFTCPTCRQPMIRR